MTDIVQERKLPQAASGRFGCNASKTPQTKNFSNHAQEFLANLQFSILKVRWIHFLIE
jgi:hypothetical protein